MPHRIAQEYNNMKLLFSRSALSDDVTRKFISINELCKTEIARMHTIFSNQPEYRSSLD